MEDEAPSSQSQSDGPLEMSIDGDVEEALPQVEVSHPPDEVFPIEKILASKRINGEVHYRIKWFGYSGTENTWEPATEIDQHLIDRFEEKRKLTNKRKYSNGRAKPDSREHSQEEPDDETQQDGQSTSQPSSSLKQKKKRNRIVKEVQEEPDDETQQDGQSTSQPSSSLKQKKKRNRIVKEVQKEPDDESQLGGQSTPMPSYSFKRKKKRNRIVKGFIKQPVIRLHRPITAMALASRNPFATGCNVRPPITAMASDDGIGGGDLGGEEVRPLIPAMASDDESGGGDGGGQESHPPITAMASDDGRGGGDGGGEKINQIHPSITAMASDDGRGGGDGGGEKSHPPITAMASDDGRGGGDRGGEEINQIHPSITAMASDDGRGGGDGGGQESHPPITAMASDDGPVDGDGGGEETNQSQPPITAMASDDGRGGGDGGGEKSHPPITAMASDDGRGGGDRGGEESGDEVVVTNEIRTTLIGFPEPNDQVKKTKKKLRRVKRAGPSGSIMKSPIVNRTKQTDITHFAMNTEETASCHRALPINRSTMSTLSPPDDCSKEKMPIIVQTDTQAMSDDALLKANVVVVREDGTVADRLFQGDMSVGKEVQEVGEHESTARVQNASVGEEQVVEAEADIVDVSADTDDVDEEPTPKKRGRPFKLMSAYEYLEPALDNGSRRCKICVRRNMPKVYSLSRAHSVANFMRHMKSLHTAEHELVTKSMKSTETERLAAQVAKKSIVDAMLNPSVQAKEFRTTGHKMLAAFVGTSVSIPYLAIENLYLQQAISLANPLIKKLPSRREIREAVLDLAADVAEAIRVDLRTRFSKVTALLDIWTTTSCRSYLGVLLQYTTSNGTFVTRAVALDVVLGAHTEYGLRMGDVSRFVTDAASSNRKAFRDVDLSNIDINDDMDCEELTVTPIEDWPSGELQEIDVPFAERLDCSVHQLQLVCKKIFKDPKDGSLQEKVKKQLTKVRKLVGKIMRSRAARDALFASQKLLLETSGFTTKAQMEGDNKPILLVLPALIRFNSNIDVLVRFDKLKDHVGPALQTVKDVDMDDRDIDYDLVASVCKVVTPLHVAVQRMQSGGGTLKATIPIVAALAQDWQSMVSDNKGTNGDKIVYEFATHCIRCLNDDRYMFANLQRKSADECVDFTCHVATYLSPSFYRKFCERMGTQFIGQLQEAIVNLASTRYVFTDTENDIRMSVIEARRAIKIQLLYYEKLVSTYLELGVSNKSGEQNEELTDDQYDYKFYDIYGKALNYLCIIANDFVYTASSTADVERSFGAASNVLCTRRNKLVDESVAAEYMLLCNPTLVNNVVNG